MTPGFWPRAGPTRPKLQKAVGLLNDTLSEADARLVAEGRIEMAELKMQKAIGALKASERE